MKESFSKYIHKYTHQQDIENVARGYRGLIEYLMYLRTHMMNKYSTEYIVGSFYQGYMDMSYFPVTTRFLKAKKLKIGVVFNHEKMRFEIWLLGQNKQIHRKYWNFFKEINENRYSISETGENSVIEHNQVDNPDFSQVELLTQNLENGVVKFIEDITQILEK